MITRAKIKWYEVYSKTNKERENKDKYNTHTLAHDQEKQKQYKDALQEKLNTRPEPPTWDELMEIVKSTAKETIGTQTSNNIKQEEYSDKIEQW